MKILNYIQNALKENQKLLAILIDPDDVFNISKMCENIEVFPPDLIFVGGSSIERDNFDGVVDALKQLNVAPVILS